MIDSQVPGRERLLAAGMKRRVAPGQHRSPCALSCVVSAILLSSGGIARAGGETYTGRGADNCAQSITVPIAVGAIGAPAVTTILGDSSDATDGPCAEVEGAGWWERFELAEPARVMLDFCGTVPVHLQHQLALFASCNSTSCSAPRTGIVGACPDGNLRLDFGIVFEGTYYYAIRAGMSAGPYVLHVTAEALPQLRQGPDIITSAIEDCQQLGREGNAGEGIAGFGVTTGDCNLGNVNVLVEPLPSTRHRVIQTNMYRLSTVSGATRLEQIGLSWLKHTFGASTQDLCDYGCRTNLPGGPNEYKPGCADAYFAAQSHPCSLGPRSAVHPFTAAMPGGGNLGGGGACGANFPANNHIGHTHTPGGISHLLQVRDADLMPASNPGARYFVEAAYLTPDEFLEHNGNQHNNVSYREFTVSGPKTGGVYTFSPLGETITETPAAAAWSGATQVMIEPNPMSDGRAFLSYQVTDLGNGMWRYEYLIYNMNLDASVGSLRIPVTRHTYLENIDFYAPPAHAPEENAAKYATDPWHTLRTTAELAWAADAFALDPLANAIRYGTSYNFRFDADTPPIPATAHVGIFKTGQSVMVPVLGPSAPVPAASSWGLAALAIVILVAGTLVLGRRETI